MTTDPVSTLGASVPGRPRVLFVCVKNAGKSQMAAGLMRHVAGDTVEVRSAGTKAGTSLNKLSVASLLEVGVDITGEHPKALTEEMVADADVVVILGREAHVAEVADTRFFTWVTDEPSRARHRRHRADAPGPRRYCRPRARPGRRPRHPRRAGHARRSVGRTRRPAARASQVGRVTEAPWPGRLGG